MAEHKAARSIVDPMTGTERTIAIALGARMDWLRDLQDAEWSDPIDLAICFAIQRHVNAEKGYAELRHATIAEEAGVALRTVEKRLPLIVKHGALIQRRGGPSASRYFLAMEEPHATTEQADERTARNDGTSKVKEPHDVRDCQNDRTARQGTKNRTSDGQEPHLSVPRIYKEGTRLLNSLSELAF